MMSHASVVDIYDPETECIVASTALDESQTEKIALELGLNADDLAKGMVFELDGSDLSRIESTISVDFGDKATTGKLRVKLDIDDLPYQVHTNRELRMMLLGKKPLAVFSHPCGSESSAQEIPERLFDPYVSSGRFVKREVIEPSSSNGSAAARTVFFATPSDAWRIDAYLALMGSAQVVGWSEELERQQGRLLGYTERENDAYLEFLRKRSSIRPGER
jgi:hypothetical protein